MNAIRILRCYILSQHLRIFDSIQFQGCALSKIEGNPVAQQMISLKKKKKKERLGFFCRPGTKVQEGSVVPPKGAKGDIHLRKVSHSGM